MPMGASLDGTDGGGSKGARIERKQASKRVDRVVYLFALSERKRRDATPMYSLGFRPCEVSCRHLDTALRALPATPTAVPLADRLARTLATCGTCRNSRAASNSEHRQGQAAVLTNIGVHIAPKSFQRATSNVLAGTTAQACLVPPPRHLHASPTSVGGAMDRPRP